MAAHVTFDTIYHGLDTTPGKLRLQEGGLGWKATASQDGSSGATFTLEADKMATFQWMRWVTSLSSSCQDPLAHT